MLLITYVKTGLKWESSAMYMNWRLESSDFAAAGLVVPFVCDIRI